MTAHDVCPDPELKIVEPGARSTRSARKEQRKEEGERERVVREGGGEGRMAVRKCDEEQEKVRVNDTRGQRGSGPKKKKWKGGGEERSKRRGINSKNRIMIGIIIIIIINSTRG